ncbi:3D-(3,5/4)-trihydroxycyclohexane-1,2-dione acylhydrolase (decyclizing) [Martelella endophytica]|uniref:3D-(3,5/4)-trihydroxycyclohexane-1,2-dione hydrolase n=1 Tax=Martelella endophytica TaxID=1486262 RepID=A0A0D5LS22_MAREN|nr:3D-(3,5/4)-trihydroxycyclohexane-1,2-dione acylhydrolase (decyclizing) [Martelella endophytica]AJY46173.1 3D-(3,5/4)-trihydroxycyclohexane-1,2-dione hydrolase [Martelella endophytica]
MSTIRLTAAQALVRYLAAQKNEEGEQLIPGCWAIFGHGNVAGIGEALAGAGDALPTWRGHNEQTMAHAAIAFAKAKGRRQFMAVTTSIGPGATNMVTAAALAHVNRLPVLLIPGDVFANRAPDPVLQQVEDFDDGTVSANDCFRPVSRYFDRITRPEQLLSALPRAIATLTDPERCGPATLAFCQDVQAEAYDYPESFFAPKTWRRRRPQPDQVQFEEAVAAIKAARRPVIIAGGGVHYSGACETLKAFAEAHDIPVTETQAGKSALAHDHPLNLGSIGVTGTSASNAVAEDADLVIGVGTRFQDFTTGSWALFKNPARKILAINTSSYDAVKHNALSLVADARIALERLSDALGDTRFTPPSPSLKEDWMAAANAATADPGGNALPTDAQVIGAVQRQSTKDSVVVCAAGGLPGELHKLWLASRPGGYHMEYGYSCMGYEIAAGLGVKMAEPERDVIVMIGDGSYMMANSELATSVMLGLKITVVLLDNRGFGCINRLQMATGGKSFNNLLDTARHQVASDIDFAAHAAALGATSEKVDSISALEEALARAKNSEKSHAIVIDTDPLPSTEAGGHWWDVAVPEVSTRAEVNAARKAYEEDRRRQRTAD